jgi:hypothetical protein
MAVARGMNGTQDTERFDCAAPRPAQRQRALPRNSAL